ncbi:MAG: hypothetical protein H7Y01_14150 [Ferruginibacter sp.]|nr:hypothetical protein [Chitinophagaceae bacterium]
MGINIPALHNSSKSAAEGSAKISIPRRSDALHSGVFTIKGGVSFDPPSTPYPTGAFRIQADLSDSLKATFTTTSVELINAFGKHTPSIFLTGRCNVRVSEAVKRPPVGCRYWIMIVNNKKEGNEKDTPDIVSFAITDCNGNRVAYGTGPVVSGNMHVDPS